MDNIETFQNQNMVAAKKTLVSDQKPTFSNQYRPSQASAVMDNIETFHYKKTVVAETVVFKFEADLFKSVPMIVSFDCHGKHRDDPS